MAHARRAVLVLLALAGPALAGEPAAPAEPAAKPPAAPVAALEAVPRAAVEPAGFASAAAAIEWLGRVYEHREYDRVPEAYRALLREHRQAEQPVGWGVMGTLAGILLEHPERTAAYHDALADLSLKDRLPLLQAAWLSRHPQGAELIARELAAAQAPELGGERDFLRGLMARAAFDPTIPPLRSVNHLQVLWGHFAATGQDRWVIKTFEAFEVQMDPETGEADTTLADAAASALRGAALTQPRARRILEQQAAEGPADKRELLTELLAQVRSQLKAEEPAPAAAPAQEAKDRTP